MIVLMLYPILTGTILGFFSFWALSALSKKKRIEQALKEAQTIVDETVSSTKKQWEKQKAKMHTFRTEELTQLGLFEKATQNKLKHIQSRIKRNAHLQNKKFEIQKNILQKEKERNSKQMTLVQKQKESLLIMDEKFKKEQLKLTQVLEKRSQTTVSELLSYLCAKLETQLRQNWKKVQEEADLKIQNNIEKQAHNILCKVISRFKRPYCPLRSVSGLSFNTDVDLQNFLKIHKTSLDFLTTSLDLECSIRERQIDMLSRDPMKRKLGSDILQELSKSKVSVDPQNIQDKFNKLKNELLATAHADGKKACQQMGIPVLPPKSLKVFGTLKYRYSFTQNQYFHCLEVGFLCGLLASEINLAISKGRIAGMLHDIGKAIDHCKNGGHAVVGADLIEKEGLPTDIVYAVKAHHRDVPPQNPLDFLVIAADAISGARPGARRSTIASYSQKVSQLEQIGRSFSSIKDVYVLSAGRELRVFVDSQTTSDQDGLKLSRALVEKIEKECHYPSQIKVSVIREKSTVEKIKSFASRH